MIKLFSSNKIIISILFLPILLCLAGIDYYQGTEIIQEVQQGSSLSSLMLAPFYSLPVLYQYMFSALLIFVQLILLIVISNKHQLQKSTNLLVGLFFVIFLAFIPQPLVINGSLIANFFIIGSIDQVLDSYKKHKAFGNIINAGFFIGIASLFNPVLIFLLIWAYIAILQLRSFKLAERILLLIATLLPYYLLGVWMLFKGNLTSYFNSSFFEPFYITKLSTLSQKEIIGLIMILTAAVVLIINFRNYLVKRSMVVQRKISSLFFFFVFSLFLFLFEGFTSLNLIILLALPMSVFSSILAQNANPKWAELITLLLVINILCLRVEFILAIFGLN